MSHLRTFLAAFLMSVTAVAAVASPPKTALPAAAMEQLAARQGFSMAFNRYVTTRELCSITAGGHRYDLYGYVRVIPQASHRMTQALIVVRDGEIYLGHYAFYADDVKCEPAAGRVVFVKSRQTYPLAIGAGGPPPSMLIDGDYQRLRK